MTEPTRERRAGKLNVRNQPSSLPGASTHWSVPHWL